LSERAWQRIRGNRIAMIFQEPMAALNPVMPVGQQIMEVFELQVFNDAGKIQQVRVFFDEDSVLP